MSDAFERAARAAAPNPEGPSAGDAFAGILSMILRLNAGATTMGGGFGATATTAGTAGLFAGAPPAMAAIAGMYGIGRAGQRGDALGRYNAFLVSFARAVSDFSRGRDQRRANVAYRDASVRGRNASIKLLTTIGAAERAEVFAKYRRMRDGQAVEAIVAAMGGLRTR